MADTSKNRRQTPSVRLTGSCCLSCSQSYFPSAPSFLWACFFGPDCAKDYMTAILRPISAGSLVDVLESAL